MNVSDGNECYLKYRLAVVRWKSLLILMLMLMLMLMLLLVSMLIYDVEVEMMFDV